MSWSPIDGSQPNEKRTNSRPLKWSQQRWSRLSGLASDALRAPRSHGPIEKRVQVKLAHCNLFSSVDYLFRVAKRVVVQQCRATSLVGLLLSVPRYSAVEPTKGWHSTLFVLFKFGVPR